MHTLVEDIERAFPQPGVVAREGMRAWASFDAERLDETAPHFGQIGEGYFAILIDQGQGMTPRPDSPGLGLGLPLIATAALLRRVGFAVP